MIEARLMIEVLGKPKEILIKTLEKVVSTIEERYKLLHSEIMKPKKVKNSDLFSAVLEVEVDFDNFEDLFLCILDFGPTFVEILSPKEFTIKAVEVQNAIADLITKLHLLSKKIEHLTLENLHYKKVVKTSKK